jgi:hypothetical protein
VESKCKEAETMKNRQERQDELYEEMEVNMMSATHAPLAAWSCIVTYKF